MFVDKTTIKVFAGHGGAGACSFRREMFVPYGGPDGGDGGNGGSVVLHASANERSLVDLKFQPIWKAQRGGDGAGRKMHGKNAPDCVIRVPVGTIVFDAETNELICDLKDNDQEFVVAKGGRGGLGNVHFVSSTNQAPRKCQPGTDGEEKTLDLELKTVADVGLVGYPNAGKSTFLSAVSNARPKTAPYPFTTLTPNVGVVETDDYRRYTIADIPGLIEGAHENVGLGHAFLRHIERCRILCYVLDMAGTDGRDPLDDLASLRNELFMYEPDLANRPFIIVANKIDMPESEENLKRLKAAEPEDAVILPTCAELGEHTEEVILTLRKMLDVLPPLDDNYLNLILSKRRQLKEIDLRGKDDSEDW